MPTNDIPAVVGANQRGKAQGERETYPPRWFALAYAITQEEGRRNRARRHAVLPASIPVASPLPNAHYHVMPSSAWGSEKVKVLPSPTVDVTQIRPFCKSSSALVIASPSPVPPVARWRDLSAR